LVWCAFSLSERDMEMSCDETVMCKMGTDLRAAYSASLLNLASGKKVFAGAPLGFGEGNVKCRIQNIMRYKKTAALIAVPVLALVIIVSVALGSNPTNNNSEENDINKQQATSSTSNSDNVEIIPVTSAVVTEETIFGADGPRLDYADENMFIFHGDFGLFVYDINQGELVSAVDLEPIGCQDTQGDAYCEVVVAKNGQKVYLHPMNIEDMYVYDVSEERLTRQNYDLQGVELFDNLKSTEPDPTAWRSINCVPLGSDRCLYLENTLGMVKELCYIVEQNHEQVRFARIFDDDAEEAGPFGSLNYTGYLDSCKKWDGYEQFTYQDYDGDGKVDRVYQKTLVPDEWCLYEIQFGNGDVIETGLFGIGLPEIKTCDLNGDGVMEILLQVSYAFSTNSNGYGEIAIFEKKNGFYEPLMPPAELCTNMEGSDIYHPSITIVCKNGGDEFPEWASMPADVYQEVNAPHMHVAVKELTGKNAIDEMVYLDSNLMMDFANTDTEQEYRSVSYKAEIVNNGKNDLIEFHFEALNKWCMDEVVVTAIYENGALHVAGARYEREGNIKLLE
ncbi:MAG: hypothetical protein K2M91_08245, partial [Lachnospiraceae bacterium]|nr:hypothetical protein [Lachnospiraceae bacterium]